MIYAFKENNDPKKREKNHSPSDITLPYLTVKNGDYVFHRAPNNQD